MFESAANAEDRPTNHSPWDAGSSAQGTLSPNTERALRSDWRIFTTWCTEEDLDALPAQPQTLAAFVDAMAKRRAPATVRRYLASITATHRAQGLDTPRTEPVRQALRRMDRKKGRRQAQAKGLNWPLLQRMLATGGDAPTAARNRALLAVAYDTLLRRSELVGLRVEDLIRDDDGSATVLVRKTKTDQEGHGALAWIAPDSVALLARWLSESRVREGPMFRALRNGVVGGPLGACEIPRIFKEMALEAGLPHGVVKDISGHSTRVGACQDMVSKGIGMALIMQTGRWKNEASVIRYAERMLAQQNGAAQLARLQRRM